MKKTAMLALVAMTIGSTNLYAGSDYRDAVAIQQTCEKIQNSDVGATIWSIKERGLPKSLLKEVLDEQSSGGKAAGIKGRDLIIDTIYATPIKTSNEANLVAWAACMDFFTPY